MRLAERHFYCVVIFNTVACDWEFVGIFSKKDDADEMQLALPEHITTSHVFAFTQDQIIEQLVRFRLGDLSDVLLGKDPVNTNPPPLLNVDCKGFVIEPRA